jgi:hypothetical protein
MFFTSVFAVLLDKFFQGGEIILTEFKTVAIFVKATFDAPMSDVDPAVYHAIRNG